jgi:hypothetical protein
LRYQPEAFGIPNCRAMNALHISHQRLAIYSRCVDSEVPVQEALGADQFNGDRDEI